MGKTFIFAISGVKNSGKTTLITRILPFLNEQGLKVATIKHDGHEFHADVPGTDSYRHLCAGAYGTAIFSEHKYMAVKQQPGINEEQLIALFPEADMILLEGFKHSSYPKIEVIRRGNSEKCVCSGNGLKAIATNLTMEELWDSSGNLPVFLNQNVPLLDIDCPQAIADFIMERYRGEKRKGE